MKNPLTQKKEAFIAVVKKICAALGFEKFTDLHLHSKDACDSDNPADAVCEKEKELGATAVALTQHGVASQIFPFKKAAKKNGLKFIPGIEAYYQTEEEKSGLKHLLLLAKNDKGWKALCMAISATQNKDGLSVMKEADLWKFFGPGSEGHGNVIATTACVSGIIADILLRNHWLEKDIAKRLSRLETVSDTEYNNAAVAKDSVASELAQTKERYETMKKLASRKYGTKERAVKKLSSDERTNAEAELRNLKKASEDAAREIPGLRSRIQQLKKELSEKTRVWRSLEEKRKKREAVLKMKEERIPKEQLIAQATEAMEKLRTVFGEGNFFAEVQNHGIDIEEIAYPMTAAIARNIGVPIVATNDVHIVDNSEEELLRRRMLRTLRFKKWSEDNVGDSELYIKTNEELVSKLLEILPEDVVLEAMQNTQRITEMCNVELQVKNHYPKFISPDGRSSEEVFDELIEKGIRIKFPNGLPDGYRERIEQEKSIMKKMGYVDYHLVVMDFLRYAAKHNKIPPEKIQEAPINEKELDAWMEKNGYTVDVGMSTGAGRGSAVGSLVCDLLFITGLDPIQYKLFFERFLNPERISMPDIDSDISNTVRGRVIEYVKQKYGESCVVAIMTQNAIAPKGAARIAAKCYGLYLHRNDRTESGEKVFLSLGDQIAKKIPDDVGTTFDTELSGGKTVFEDMLEKFSSDPNAMEIIRWARVFEGCFTAYSMHAAGIVITDGTPVSEIVPPRWNEKALDGMGMYTTQCDMVEVEENGMLKFDFLGLKTLDVITECLWFLYKKGIHLRTEDIPLDDKRVYKYIFAAGKTHSVFQFESAGMRKMLRRFGPTCFEDLIILVSMFRPGPMQYLDDVIDVKNGRKPLTFLTPELEPILSSTYGGVTYQEQVMQIFQQLAGYSLGQADLVRRAMSKKKTSVLEKERKAFIYGDPDRKDAHGYPTPIKGCVNNGVSEKVANILFDQMMDFARYAFNKSHAAAYALLAYITAYLKLYYPAEFLTAAMNWAGKDQKKDPIPGLMTEAKAMGVEVCAPDINVSEAKFTTDGKKIFFGLSAVKTVGASADKILEERNKNGSFVSFPDFYRRCKTRKNTVANLTYAGAFDRFTKNRSALVKSLDEYKNALDAVSAQETFLKTAEAMLPVIDTITTKEDLISRQKELNLHKELTSVTTSEKLLEKIRDKRAALEKAEKSFAEVTVSETEENQKERMEKEHELLGAYVTKHPLDSYPSFAEITPIADVSSDTEQIFGVISAMEIKKRKKDGKDMAFLTVEDRTGAIKANLFVDQYRREKKNIAVGNVLVLYGETKEENYNADDEDDEKTYEFIVNKTVLVDEGRDVYRISVPSYPGFYAGGGAYTLREKCQKRFGSRVLVYDQRQKTVRELPFRVGPEIEQVFNCG